MIELSDVTYTYKTKYQTVNALDGVSYRFVPGRFYAVVGSSGSGKSTLLSLVAGLDTPSSGSVIFNDKDTRNLNRDKYRLEHVSVIYQSLNLFPLLTAMENVTFNLEYKGTRGSKARKLASEKLESVGIDKGKHGRRPSMLSGGEQQRVAIARALAANTEIILADEPTGSLDSQNSTNVIALLKELAASENVCLIVVTHDPEVAESADVVIRLSDGKILEIIDRADSQAYVEEELQPSTYNIAIPSPEPVNPQPQTQPRPHPQQPSQQEPIQEQLQPQPTQRRPKSTRKSAPEPITTAPATTDSEEYSLEDIMKEFGKDNW
ncbi:MAG: ATP-binding cassette domain-containing protein [Oscillospiraceae bacterium]|nr:ATP-binding cassette domain-containing protein [Oscillospiraceae bacterium]